MNAKKERTPYQLAIFAALLLLAGLAEAQTGLWIGRITLDRVSEPVSGSSPSRPAGDLPPTPAPLQLSVILHQDTGGQVRLLKSFIQMRDPATNEYVFVTDDTQLHLFEGVTLRDGESVGRRLSAVGYDFSPNGQTTHNDTALKCTGSLAGTVACKLVLNFDHPTNPFLHRYHPDHDNLASEFSTTQREARHVVRQLTFDFSSTYPPGEATTQDAPPGWGSYLLGGSYSEEIKGLYRNSVKDGSDYRPAAGVASSGAIYVEGSFMLQRISERGTINE